MDEALLAEIQSLTENFRATLDKMPQDYIRRQEVEKMVGDIVEKLHPKQESKFFLPVDSVEGIVERLASFKQRPEAYEKALPWTSDYGKNFGDMKTFLLAISGKHPAKEGLKVVMSEGDNAQGGYLVPTEFNAEVIRLQYTASIIRGISRVLPMSTWKRTFPNQLTNVAIYWVTELGAKTTSKPTFGRLTQTAKVMAAIIKSSDELLRDSAINLQTFLAELVSEAMGREEERVALVGNTGAGDPFMGVRYAVGVIANTMAGASLVFDDILDLEFSVAEPYQRNGQYVMPRASLLLIMKLKDNQGNYIWERPREGQPGAINGKSYAISDQIVAIAGKYPILFGDFKRYLFISPRQGITVKVSQDASDWVSGALDSAFMTDQTWLRFTQAESIDVAVPAAFGYLDAI